MFGAISAGIKALAGLFNIIGWFQKRSERNEYRRAGQQEQKIKDLKARESQAGKANEIDEAVRALDDNTIQRELHDHD